MNTVQNTTIALNAAEQAELEEWCAEVRAIFAEHSRPIDDQSDPRLKALGSLSAFGGDADPEQLGKLYAAFNSPSYPSLPIQTPNWVERVEVKVDTYPNITIFYWGKNWADQSMRIQIAQVATVGNTEDETDEQVAGPFIELLDPPRLEVDVPDDLTAEQALDLASALVAAARELEVALR